MYKKLDVSKCAQNDLQTPKDNEGRIVFDVVLVATKVHKDGQEEIMSCNH